MPSLEVGMVAEACRVSVSRSNHNGSVREIQIGFGRLLSTCQSCNLKFGKTFYWAVQKMHSFFILLLTDKIKLINKNYIKVLTNLRETIDTILKQEEAENKRK
jgi:hypothetical protein